MNQLISCPKCSSENVVFSKKRGIHFCEDCNSEFIQEKPFVQKRLFLSYGHDKHVSLAERLRDDLQARGHDVWFDDQRLQPGHDWEAFIEKGIEHLVADKSNAAVVLLLTPHAVRRPDGYCLNEVARALSKGLRLIPLMVVDSEPPLSICRIQWLDMRECIPIQTKETFYFPRFERLIKAIEDDQLDFEGTQQRLLKALLPLEFDADILSHVPKFIGRKWIFDKVNTWLEKKPPKQRIFWITGIPGSGKTAMSAALSSRYSEVAALHLCKFGHAQKGDPRSVVSSIVYQLSTQLPEYESKLASLDLERLVQDDAFTMFDNLLVQPMSKLNQPNRSIIIMIDALDEATNNGRNELASFIASEFHKTQPWLHLIITSRPEPEVTAPLQEYNPFIINIDSKENLQDLRDYLMNELASQLIENSNSNYLLDQIITKSEGVFLYITWFCNDIRNGNLSLVHPEQFPQGLGGVYFQFLKRKFPDIDKYRKDVRPALRVILAAIEPLPLDILQLMFNWEDEELKDFLRDLGSLFSVSQENNKEVIKPYHKSLSDWLSIESKSTVYFVSILEGHKALANYGWLEFQNNVQEMSLYSLFHVVDHCWIVGYKDKSKAIESDSRYNNRLMSLIPDNLKIHNNPHFIGRDQLLEDIFNKLISNTIEGTQASHIIALTGMGGVGKSSLALEYALKFRRKYKGIFWIDCQLGIEKEFAGLFDLLISAKPASQLKEYEKASTVMLELSREDSPLRLIIFDNPTDCDSVINWFPKKSNCHYIVTSRNADWPKFVSQISVPLLSKISSRELLMERTKRKWNDLEENERSACDQLIEMLGYLPLTLGLAAAFICKEDPSFGFIDYLKIVKNAEIKGQTGLLSSNSFNSVWITTFQKLSIGAQAIIQLASFMSNKSIIIDMFLNVDEQIAQQIKNIAHNENAYKHEDINVVDWVGELVEFSLITSVGNNDYTLHPLIQELVRNQIKAEEKNKVVDLATDIFTKFAPLPSSKYENWAIWKSLLPHAEALWSYQSYYSPEKVNRKLLDGIYGCYYARGKYNIAEKYIRLLLNTCESELGFDHSETLECRYNLAKLLTEIVKYEEAEILFRKTLYAAEQLGSEEITMVIMNELARLSQLNGKFSEAELLLKQVISISDRILGPDDLNSLACLNNLAVLQINKGRYNEAEVLIRKTLASRVRLLGIEHPDTVESMSNLAIILTNRGDYSGAESLLRHLVVIGERIWGAIHPNLAGICLRLALLLQEIGHFEEAEPIYNRALKIYVETNFQETIQLKALELSFQGKIDEAKKLLQVLLNIGFNIPRTCVSLIRLCLFTERLSDVQEYINIAWQHLSGAPHYVLARILFFKVTLAFLNRTSLENYIGQLRSILLKDDAFNEWMMQPTLDRIKPQITESQYALLSALVAAMSNNTNMEKLNEFEEWRDAKPEEIE